MNIAVMWLVVQCMRIPNKLNENNNSTTHHSSAGRGPRLNIGYP